MCAVLGDPAQKVLDDLPGALGVDHPDQRHRQHALRDRQERRRQLAQRLALGGDHALVLELLQLALGDVGDEPADPDQLPVVAVDRQLDGPE
ncbi:hypothetical protein [Nannocystis pusilla]|uniref:hypothetical protein n=1 Tax=Nannocystis pusilla TaxID=889268 RepID=UPI003B7F734B